MGLESLLGNYEDSDEDPKDPAPPGPATPALQEPKQDLKPKAAKSQPAKPPSKLQEAPAKPEKSEADRETDAFEKHSPHCECQDCSNLLARFSAKTLQTKGIKFKCRLCAELFGIKSDAGLHFQSRHAAELQAFKKEKEPKLFLGLEQKRAAAVEAARKMSFARDDVLGRKRPADDAAAFGGWAKKEKPEPPPCELPGYQDMMNDSVITAGVPWMGARPSDEDATDMDRDIDRMVQEAQQRRFSGRNVLEVNPTTCRCKLCYKTLGSVRETEKHIAEMHQVDFMKEMKLWERYLFTSCRRQPPFGWVCKVCQIFFPSDGSVWRHLGKEVFIRKEERHLTLWQEKEDRWGHEEDGECCGDGINYGQGLSAESVEMFNKQQEQEMEQRRKEAEAKKQIEQSSSEDEAPVNAGKINFIKEF